MEFTDSGGGLAKLARAQARTAELLGQAFKALAGPRRIVAVRDEKGDIVESIDVPLT
jgi:hypothetical protein